MVQEIDDALLAGMILFWYISKEVFYQTKFLNSEVVKLN